MERGKAKLISHAKTRLNKTIDSYRCFHIDREHSHSENANVFFFVQSDEYFEFRNPKSRADQ